MTAKRSVQPSTVGGRYLTTRQGLRVYEVSGGQVRDRLATDFTMGGHRRVYPFIPQGEVWIERGLGKRDREALILHETTEVAAMRRGCSYPKAHRLATQREYRFRHKPATKTRRRKR